VPMDMALESALFEVVTLNGKIMAKALDLERQVAAVRAQGHVEAQIPLDDLDRFVKFLRDIAGLQEILIQGVERQRGSA